MKTCWDDELDPAEIALWRRVRRAVQNLPELDLGWDEETGEIIELSCHLLARAVGAHFNLTVETGVYAGAWSHSWNATSAPNIIDAYPPATLADGPILVVAQRRFALLPERKLYQVSINETNFVNRQMEQLAYREVLLQLTEALQAADRQT